MSANWMLRRVGDFATRVKEINSSGTELPPLSVTKDRGVMLQSEKFSKRIATDLRKYLIARRGQFVFDPMSLYYGAIGRNNTVDVGVVSPDYVVFEVDETIDGCFLECLLRSPGLHKEYATRAEGGSQLGKRRRVYWSTFGDISVRVPDLRAQKIISETVVSVDTSIRSTQAVIGQLKEVRATLMGELFTRGIPGLHTSFKAASFGSIPETWEVVLLDSVARRGSGHTPSKDHDEYWNGSIKWLSLKDCPRLDRLYIATTTASITPLGIANSSAVEHPVGVVVLSRDAGVGKSAITTDAMAVSQHFMAWECGPRLDNHYLYYLLQYWKPRFERIAIGNTIKTIGLPYFKSLEIPLPPLPEQVKIATALKSVDLRLFQEEAYLASLNEARTSLLAGLLTNQVRVPLTPAESP